MVPDAPRLRRARPVADAPIDGPLARADELAKGWVLALLERAPLHRATVILTELVTRNGPRVCDAALRALAEESDLRRLEPGGALRRLAGEVGEMTGSTAATDASRAVDALHDVLWTALRDELRAPDAELVTDLSARLVHVCALIRDAALERAVGSPGGGRELSAVPPEDAALTPPEDAEPTGPIGPGATPPPEDAEPTRPIGPGAAPGADPRASAPSATPPTTPPAPPPARSSTATAGGGATPLWMSALADEVRSSGATERPLSLLLAELEDADRVLASASVARAGEASGEFVAALRRVLRSHDVLVWESDGRAWVIARETPREAAHALAARIAEAVGETGSPGGAVLAASVGVAVLGEDGATSDDLIDAAEEARFSASARGIGVSRRVPERDRRGG